MYKESGAEVEKEFTRRTGVAVPTITAEPFGSAKFGSNPVESSEACRMPLNELFAVFPSDGVSNILNIPIVLFTLLLLLLSRLERGLLA